MMKKVKNNLVVTILILGLSQQAFAHPIPCGPYFAIDAGINHFSSEINDDLDADSASRFSMAATGFIANAMLGWAFFMNNWYFALEGLAGFNTAEDKDSRIDIASTATPNGFAEHDLYSRYQFGGAFNLGYMLMKTLLFIRLGLLWSQYKLARRDLDGTVINEDERRSETLFGISPGVGMALMLTDCLMLSSLFTYTIYQSHTFKNLDTDPLNDDFAKSRICPRVAAFTIGLTWFFGQGIGFQRH